MNIALVDDERAQLDDLRVMLTDALSALGIALRRMDAFSSGRAFLDSFAKGSYDVILLDIYMGDESGVEVARRIRQTDTDVLLAFCTSSNEFASESYEVAAGYYLTKPISEEKLIGMLKRLNLSKIERNRTICLPDGFRCLLRHIVFTEYSNHAVIFHIEDAKPHSVYMNQSDAQALLTHYKHFQQVNKGCIVNFSMVKALSDGAFVMKTGESIPIARRRFKEIHDAYTSFRFEQMSREVEE